MTCSGTSFTGIITGIPITGTIHTCTMILGTMILGIMIPGTDLITILTTMVLTTVVITTIPHIPIMHIRHRLLVVEELQVILLTAALTTVDGTGILAATQPVVQHSVQAQAAP